MIEAMVLWATVTKQVVLSFIWLTVWLRGWKLPVTQR